MPLRSIGAIGSQSLLMTNVDTARSIVATRRAASASRGVIPFQMPQMFPQLSHPTPLKGNCKSSVSLRFQRSEMLTMCRGSCHLYLSTMGTNGNELPPGHDVPGQRFVRRTTLGSSARDVQSCQQPIKTRVELRLVYRH